MTAIKHIKHLIAMGICAVAAFFGHLFLGSFLVSLRYSLFAKSNTDGLLMRLLESYGEFVSYLPGVFGMLAVGIITYMTVRKVKQSELTLKSKMLLAVESGVAGVLWALYGCIGFIFGILQTFLAFKRSGVAFGFKILAYWLLGFLLYVVAWIVFPFVISLFAMLVSSFSKKICGKIEHKKISCMIFEALVFAIFIAITFIVSFFVFKYLYEGTDSYACFGLGC